MPSFKTVLVFSAVVLLYFCLLTYPFFRLGTLVNTAIFQDDSVDSSDATADFFVPTGHQSINGVHHTLTPIWVGLAYSVVSLTFSTTPLALSIRPGSALSHVIRCVCVFFWTITVSILFSTVACLVWEVVNAFFPSAHGDVYHGNGALISVAVICGLTFLRTVANIALAVPIFEKHLTITSSRIKAPLTIAQISDVHIGTRPASALRRTARILKRNKYDALAITGDLFDMPCVDEHELDPLLECPGPMYFVAGNHDLFATIALLDRHRSLPLLLCPLTLF